MPVQDPGAAGAQREGRGSVRVRVEGAAADSGPRREAKGLPVQQEQRQGEKERYNSKEFLKEKYDGTGSHCQHGKALFHFLE